MRSTLPPRRTFVLETLLPASESRSAGAQGLAGACRSLREHGHRIDYLGALLVPEDELVLHLLDAGSAAIVRRAAEEAGLAVERLVESIPVVGSGRAIRIAATSPDTSGERGRDAASIGRPQPIAAASNPQPHRRHRPPR